MYNCISVYSMYSMCAWIFTLAGDHVLGQLIALLTLAKERANQVVAVVLTGSLHITFIHIWNKCRRLTYIFVGLLSCSQISETRLSIQTIKYEMSNIMKVQR